MHWLECRLRGGPLYLAQGKAAFVLEGERVGLSGKNDLSILLAMKADRGDLETYGSGKKSNLPDIARETSPSEKGKADLVSSSHRRDSPAALAYAYHRHPEGPWPFVPGNIRFLPATVHTRGMRAVRSMDELG